MIDSAIPTFILASNNVGKLKEFNALFAQHQISATAIPQRDFAVSDAIEDGLSFVENAIIKARHACCGANLPAIADDSGLEIDALQGKPGIYSARYAGEHGNDQANIERVLRELSGVPHEQRRARFRCVLAFMRHANDPMPLVCQGTWEGFILEAPQGDNGFGYDPIFWVPDQACSSAELTKIVKNTISHRARALQQFIQQFAELPW